jgi:hypothetical protein
MKTHIGILALLLLSCNYHNNHSSSIITTYTPNNTIVINEFIKIIYLYTDTFIGYEKQRELVRCNPVIISDNDTIIIPGLSRELCGFLGTQESDISPNKKFINLNRIEYGWVEYEDSLIWHENAFNYVIDLETGKCMNSNHIQSGGEWTGDNKFKIGSKIVFNGN